MHMHVKEDQLVRVHFHSPAGAPVCSPEQRLAFKWDFSSPFTLFVLSFYLSYKHGTFGWVNHYLVTT